MIELIILEKQVRDTLELVRKLQNQNAILKKALESVASLNETSVDKLIEAKSKLVIQAKAVLDRVEKIENAA